MTRQQVISYKIESYSFPFDNLLIAIADDMQLNKRKFVVKPAKGMDNEWETICFKHTHSVDKKG